MSRRKTMIGLTLAAMAVLASSSLIRRARAAEEKAKASAARVFELRTYSTHPAKMADLHKRFRDHTNRLFVKHGMEIVGYWTPVDGEDAENTLIYMLAHKSRDAAKKSWADFQADPDWQAARKASEAAGPIVMKFESRFLNPTDYSPIR